MQQSSNKITNDSNPENALKKFLEKSKSKTGALKKLLKFIKDKEIENKKPVVQNQDRN